MTIPSLSQKLEYFFLIAFGILFILGGTGVYRELSLFLNIALVSAFLGYKLARDGHLIVPKNFYIYMAFVAVLFAHTLLTGARFMFFWLFLSGGATWLTVYNFKKLFEKHFLHLTIGLALAMGLAFFYSLARGISSVSPDSHFLPLAPHITHNHIADLWAVTLVAILFKLSEKPRFWHLIMIPLGVFFLTMGTSRSADLSLVIGAFYIFFRSGRHTWLKRAFSGVLTVAVLLAVYAGLAKTTLFSRPYFWTAIAGFFQHPLGIGMGNFEKLGSTSTLVHNVVLEVVSGMGIFSAIFIFWLYKIFKSLGDTKNANILYVAVFLAILANFFFDTTYVVPTMFWLWFVSLALE